MSKKYHFGQGDPPCEQKRNLDDDLALCNAATPGRWLHAGGMYVVTNVTGDSLEWDADYIAETASEEDAKFIAAAREGWPAALKEIERLREENERLKKGVVDFGDKERLREIEENYEMIRNIDDEKKVAIYPEDFDWLIEQAKKQMLKSSERT